MDLAANFETIRRRIAEACARAKRNPADVQLLAVSKGHGPEAVSAAADAGQTLFGENKVQEAKAKIPLCPGKLRWHFIGHLQTNKCRDAVELFEMIESVDSLYLAQEISKRADQAGKIALGYAGVQLHVTITLLTILDRQQTQYLGEPNGEVEENHAFQEIVRAA